MSGEYDYLFKIIVIGDGAVGKTSLTIRFAHGYFKEDYKMTIGVDFAVKTVTVDTRGGVRVAKLQIWDTGGQERFSYIRPLYYRGAMGGLLVFDVTKRESFEHLDGWLEEVGRHCSSIPMIMVGNKTDMPGRAVSVEEALEFAINRNMLYFETSAKEGTNVESAFGDLTRIMIDYF
nr:GTP-binding protein [Candidatus Freyarchaeota archaeon]